MYRATQLPSTTSKVSIGSLQESAVDVGTEGDPPAILLHTTLSLDAYTEKNLVDLCIEHRVKIGCIQFFVLLISKNIETNQNSYNIIIDDFKPVIDFLVIGILDLNFFDTN